jgi:peptide/nickel transport system substrate-binding protein
MAPTAAPAMAPPTAAPVHTTTGGTVKVVGHAGTFTFVDPHATGLIMTGFVGRQVYEQLFTRDGEFNVKPQLVEDWSTNDDSTVWTFKLREGKKFHNGDPLRVEDVIESIKRNAVLSSISRSYYRGFSGKEASDDVKADIGHMFEKVDENTLTITLDKPSSYILTIMAQIDPFMPSVMHEDIYKNPAGGKGDEATKTAIGTGPFSFVQWVPGKGVFLERNDDFLARTEPYDFLSGKLEVLVDKQEVLVIADHAARGAALQTGEVHFLDDFKLDVAKTLENHSDIQVQRVGRMNMGTTNWNQWKEPFNNPKVRQAVAIALPIDRIMTAAIGDDEWWRQCAFYIHCGTKWSDGAQGYGDQYQSISGDAARAAAIIEAEGVKGQHVRVISVDSTFIPEAALVIRETLEGIGFTAEILAVDTAASGEMQRGPEPTNWEMSMGWSNFFNGVDPLGPHTNSYTKGRYPSYWQDPGGKAQDIRTRFAEELDPAKQIQLTRQYDELYWEEWPRNVAMFSNPRAYRTDVLEGVGNWLYPLVYGVSVKQ